MKQLLYTSYKFVIVSLRRKHSSFAGSPFSVLCHNSSIRYKEQRKKKDTKKRRAYLAKSRDGRQVVDK